MSSDILLELNKVSLVYRALPALEDVSHARQLHVLANAQRLSRSAATTPAATEHTDTNRFRAGGMDAARQCQTTDCSRRHRRG